MPQPLTKDDTVHGETYYRASDVAAELLELQHKAGLYEKLRKLNPRQFSELHAKNIAGQGAFDDLVHSLKN